MQTHTEVERIFHFSLALPFSRQTTAQIRTGGWKYSAIGEIIGQIKKSRNGNTVLTGSIRKNIGTEPQRIKWLREKEQPLRKNREGNGKRVMGAGCLMPSQQPSASVLRLARGRLPTTMSVLFVKARVTVSQSQNNITLSFSLSCWPKLSLPLKKKRKMQGLPYRDSNASPQTVFLCDVFKPVKSLHLHIIKLNDAIILIGCACSQGFTKCSYKTWALLCEKQLTPVKPYLFIRQCMKPSHFWHSSKTDWFELWEDKAFSSLPPLHLPSVRYHSLLMCYILQSVEECMTMFCNPAMPIFKRFINKQLL